VPAHALIKIAARGARVAACFSRPDGGRPLAACCATRRRTRSAHAALREAGRRGLRGHPRQAPLRRRMGGGARSAAQGLHTEASLPPASATARPIAIPPRAACARPQGERRTARA
jgi:hypothetical protein